MRLMCRNYGSAFLLVVFIVALLAAVVMGMLQINTEEIQIMRNQIFAAKARALAEAGLAETMYLIRQDVGGWSDGFTKNLYDGSYTVTVIGSKPNLTIESVATSEDGFVCKIQTDLVVGYIFPYAIRVDSFKIN